MAEHANWVDYTTGSYDFLHPKEVQGCYIFHLRGGAPKLNCSFTLDTDYATGTSDPIEAAEEILAYANACLLYGRKKEVEELLAYLKSVQRSDALLRCRADLEKAEGIVATIPTIKQHIANYESWLVDEGDGEL